MSYEVQEDWEGNSLPSGWYEVNPTHGTITYGYTPGLRGAKSVTFAPQAGYDCGVGISGLNAGGTDTYYAAACFRFSTLPAGDQGGIYVEYQETDHYLSFTVDQNGHPHLRGVGGKDIVDNGTTLAINTTYFVWLYFKKGTGANSEASLWISATSTKPGSPILSWTNGAATWPIHVLRFVGYTGTWIFDQTYGDSGSIDDVATDYRTVTVKPSGGDYTTLQAALTGEAGNFVTLKRVTTIKCSFISGGDAIADQGSGYITSATHRLIIESEVKQTSPLNTASAYYIKNSTNYAAALILKAAYTEVRGIGILLNSLAAYGILENASGLNCLMDAVVAKGWSTRFANVYGIRLVDGTAKNCLTYGAIDNGFVVDAWGYAHFYNCGAAGTSACTNGFGGSPAGNRPIARNCWSTGYPAPFATVANWSATSSNNATSTANAGDVPGSNAQVSVVTGDFVNDAGNDYHVPVGSTKLKDHGADLSSLGWVVDLDGTARGATWDIGPFEYVPAIATYTYSGSGTVTSSGSAGLCKIKNGIGGGTVQTSGAAAICKVKTFLPSGLLQTSGAAAHARDKAYIGSGFLSTSGAAIMAKTKAPLGSGLLSTSGAAVLIKIKAFVPSGIIQTSGSAATQFGGFLLRTYTGSGLLSISGSASVLKIKTYTGAGTLHTSGSGIYTFSGQNLFVYLASGIVTLSGSAAREKSKSLAGSGTIQTSGSAATGYITAGASLRSYTGSGIIRLSGGDLYWYFGIFSTGVCAVVKLKGANPNPLRLRGA